MHKSTMRFPSAIWRFRDSSRTDDGYLFVHAEEGFVIPVLRNGPEAKRPCAGFGIWFHDYGDYEIVTTHCSGNAKHQWLHEYYWLDGDWMLWSNKDADIFHERVRDDEVPEDYQSERSRIVKLYSKLVRPPYDPNSLKTF